MKKTVIWLKRDLRVADQPLLQELKADPNRVQLLYCRFVDEDQNASRSKLQFREECLQNFCDEVGVPLVTLDSTDDSFLADLEKVFQTIKPGRFQTSADFSANECERNKQVSLLCAHMDIQYQELQTFSLFPDQNLDQLPLIFTDYRKIAETAPIAFDDLDAHEPNEANSPALRRLKYYLFGSQSILTYKQTRDGLLGQDASSHLSPYLAQGALSVKRIWFEIERFEQKVGANESTYWLKFELLWREFFLWNAKKYQNRLFEPGGIRQKSTSFVVNPGLFDEWKMGKTPNAFINANLNELRTTGWMSNRGRQIVASYLIHDLGLEWRLGAKWFQDQLIDYEPSANWGNWAYIAGVGNDPRSVRKFDVDWQRQKHDPDGEYVRRWSRIGL